MGTNGAAEANRISPKSAAFKIRKLPSPKMVPIDMTTMAKPAVEISKFASLERYNII